MKKITSEELIDAANLIHSFCATSGVLCKACPFYDGSCVLSGESPLEWAGFYIKSYEVRLEETVDDKDN